MSARLTRQVRQSKLCRIKVPAVFPFQALYFHYIIVLIFLGIITKLVSHARVRKPYFRVDPMARFWRPLTVFVLFWLQLIKPAVTSLISSSSDQLSSTLWSFHANQFDATKAVTACSDGTGSRIVLSQLLGTHTKEDWEGERTRSGQPGREGTSVLTTSGQREKNYSKLE